MCVHERESNSLTLSLSLSGSQVTKKTRIKARRRRGRTCFCFCSHVGQHPISTPHDTSPTPLRSTHSGKSVTTRGEKKSRVGSSCAVGGAVKKCIVKKKDSVAFARSMAGDSGLPSSPSSSSSFQKRAPLPLTWHDLSVDLGGKTVVQPFSGRVAAGRCLAVMGPSGSGKTTLLNALSRRGPTTAGAVFYGGKKYSASLRREIGFVEQDDIVFSELTVRETLTYSSMLRLPARTHADRAAAAARVDELLRLLRLGGCADTRVGDSSASERRGISGGERKRLTIAQELLPGPALLFCDEPTSGLDSSLALVVATAVSELARAANVTVICSIHQPSSQVFAAFTELLLLDSGCAVYHGAGSGVAERLSSLGAPCPQGWSHSDWMLEVLVNRKLSTEAMVAAQVKQSMQDGPTVDIASAAGEAGETSSAPMRQQEERHDNTWSHEVRVLSSRSWRMLRGTIWSNELGVLHTFNGLICGATWFRLGFEEADIFPRVTAIIIVYMFWTFFPLLSAPAMLDEAKVITMLRKEYSSGAYRLSAWFVTMTCVPMVKEFVWPCLHVPIFYYITGINDRPAIFALTCLLIALNLFVFNSFGLLIAVLVPKYALTTLLIFMTFFFTFTGVFVPIERTPCPWLRFANPVYYIDQIALQFTLDDEHEYVRSPASSAAIDVHGIHGSDASSSGNTTNPLPPITRAQLLNDFGVNTPIGTCLAFLLTWTVLWRLAAFLLLRRKLRRVLLSLNAVGGADSNGDGDGDGGVRPNGQGTTSPSRRSTRAIGWRVTSTSLLNDDGAKAAVSSYESCHGLGMSRRVPPAVPPAVAVLSPPPPLAGLDQDTASGIEVTVHRA
jgi:ABC-type multidrug transport system ATPase subunit